MAGTSDKLDLGRRLLRLKCTTSQAAANPNTLPAMLLMMLKRAVISSPSGPHAARTKGSPTVSLELPTEAPAIFGQRNRQSVDCAEAVLILNRIFLNRRLENPEKAEM